MSEIFQTLLRNPQMLRITCAAFTTNQDGGEWENWEHLPTKMVESERIENIYEMKQGGETSIRFWIRVLSILIPPAGPW